VQIHPIVDEGLGNASYLVDLDGERALVVDPARDPMPYLALADRLRLRITAAAETHLHADFLTGSLELARACDAQILAPAAARLGFPHRGLDDGETADLGGLGLRALATPGHAPEHTAWLLQEGNRILAAFTGGALLVGAVARTDLVGAEQTEPLARAAHRSVNRLLRLPDEVPVLPTHGAGSFCAAPAGSERTSTIGAERRGNPLSGLDEDAFVDRLLEGLGSFPPYFLRLRERNRRGPDLLVPGWSSLPQLSPEQGAAFLRDGGVLVDARPIHSFADGHPAGAVSIALRPQFATWLGWLIDPERPLVVLLEGSQDRRELARQARTIGYDGLVGELAGGFAAWREAGLPTALTPLVSPVEFAAEPTTVVLDVRQASETSAGHLPDALTIELGVLAGALAPPDQVPDGPMTVMCGHGERAMTAASLLAGDGHEDVRVLTGGPSEWAAASGKSLARP